MTLDFALTVLSVLVVLALALCLLWLIEVALLGTLELFMRIYHVFRPSPRLACFHIVDLDGTCIFCEERHARHAKH